jgi:segregation and condensation protein A
MSIKSRSLLPREEVDIEDDLDPQDELIQRLIEYRRFKGAADDLGDRHTRRSLEHTRGYRGEARMHEPEKQLDLGELTAWDLLATFSRLMRETLAGRPHTIQGDPRPLRWYVSTMATTMRSRRRASLRDLLTDFGDDTPTKQSLIGAFCALLELIKIGVVGAVQNGPEDEIEVLLKDDAEADFEELISASRFMDEDSEDEDGPEGDAAAGDAREDAPAEEATGEPDLEPDLEPDQEPDAADSASATTADEDPATDLLRVPEPATEPVSGPAAEGPPEPAEPIDGTTPEPAADDATDRAPSV